MVEYVMPGIVLRYAQPANRLLFVRCCIAGLPPHDADDEGFQHPEYYDSIPSMRTFLKSHKFNRSWSALSTQLAFFFGTGELIWTGSKFEAEMRYGYIASPASTSDEGNSRRMAVWRACFVYSGFAGLTQLARSGLANSADQSKTSMSSS